MLTTTFRNTAAATAVIEHVKHVHSFVNGTRPDGVPYHALDPELIAWVHTCIPWMIMRAYEHTKRPLTQSERDRYAQELIGFDRPSILTRNLIEPALRLDARRLRWAFGTPRYAQLALIRAAGATMREVAAP